MNITIRKMTNEDIKQVQSIAKISWNATYERIIPEKIQNNFLAMAYSDEMMQHRLNQSFMYVAETETELAGFANFTPVDENGLSELSAIYLDPRSEEHTSELQSRFDLVCRLLLEKKK